jgi:hypothetical protein
MSRAKEARDKLARDVAVINAERDRNAAFRASEDRFYGYLDAAGRKAHRAAMRAAYGESDEFRTWFVFYKTGGDLVLVQDSPGDGWAQGPEIKVGWLEVGQVVQRLIAAVKPLPWLPSDEWKPAKP